MRASRFPVLIPSTIAFSTCSGVSLDMTPSVSFREYFRGIVAKCRRAWHLTENALLSLELIIGLCLAFGLFPRLVILTSWLFINMTLTIFNWVELVGHLPLYGVMGILLVWTPREEDQRAWVSGVLGEGIGNGGRPHQQMPAPPTRESR